MNPGPSVSSAACHFLQVSLQTVTCSQSTDPENLLGKGQISKSPGAEGAMVPKEVNNTAPPKNVKPPYKKECFKLFSVDLAVS